MKTRIITLYLLFIHLLFAGCSKEEAIDNVDPDVPDVEISEEEMEILAQRVEHVDETLATLIQSCEDALEAEKYLEEIKTIEGVEDAWVNDPTTLWIKIEGFGKIAYYYPPKISYSLDSINTLLSFNSREKLPVTKSTDSQICENQNVCIINQLSEDPDQDYLKPLFKDITQSFRSQNFQVTEIEGAEFDFNFIQKELTKYGIIFLVTHGVYDETNGMHYLMTGVKHTYWQAVKEKEIYGDTEYISIIPVDKGFWSPNLQYAAVSEKYLDRVLQPSSFSKNSILFNAACQSLKADKDLYNILKSKGLGCYLGYDEKNTVGLIAGIEFFKNMLAGMNVSKAFNALPSKLKIDEFEYKGNPYIATLHSLPSDCQITLWGEAEVTDEEVVDLGLSVKWAKKNLGASNYTDKGNGYEDYKYMDIYYEDPILVGEDGEDVNLSGHSKYDYARKALGGNWRMPTSKEWQELKDKCTWKTVVIDDKPGFQVIGPNGNNIFLPGEQYQQPVMGIQYYDGLYATGTLTHTGLRSFCIMGSIAPYGINVCRVEELGIADTAFIRPVCD
ncbi:MAG TPA: hypothetical protein H9977_01165 [Candidatus Parabacteroides intestinipullorum]|uniref:Uncharacterized protein n=1 Tax=Candidatus Parabacteroides intestinipullorum TaxID=2838723 RepID=A0A9D1X932_9BACT|nr:hypothetical protein [Candidatus Parabacteroides intestinipullorum]